MRQRTKSTSRRRRPAFTLVELLVVIGIIAVLIGILLPTLGRARAHAKKVACMSNLRQIGQAIQMYTVANRGSLPIGDWEGACYDGAGNKVVFGPVPERATRWNLLVKKTLDPRLDATWTGSAQTGGDTAKLQELFQCPEAPGDNNKQQNYSSTITYQCHPILMPGIDSTTDSTRPLFPGTTIPTRPYNIAKVRRSAEVALVFDCAMVYENGIWHTYQESAVANFIDNGGWWRAPTYLWAEFNDTTNKSDSSINLTPHNFTPAQTQYVNKDVRQNARNVRFRHDRETVANALMVDGHVESFTYDPKKPPNDPNVSTFKKRNLYVNRP